MYIRLTEMASPALPPPRHSFCTEKARLLREYDCASSELARSTALLAQRSDVLSNQEYESIWSFTQAAHVRCDNAHVALLQHRADHGCW